MTRRGILGGIAAIAGAVGVGLPALAEKSTPVVAAAVDPFGEPPGGPNDYETMQWRLKNLSKARQILGVPDVYLPVGVWPTDRMA